LLAFPGDAADPTLCASLRTTLTERFGGRLDLLVCNACPPLRSHWLEAAALARIVKYITESVAMVAAPMAALLSMLADHSGFNVVISSSFVSDPPRAWPHYIAAKRAIEGLVQVSAQQYPRTKSVIVRPPRLRTEFANLPGGRPETVVGVETIARRLIARLAEPHAAGTVFVLDQFPIDDDQNWK
jgi:NAD(P)-dependent dehydrogenase (short-subunit alcohol dehydrogenase family)